MFEWLGLLGMLRLLRMVGMVGIVGCGNERNVEKKSWLRFFFPGE